MSRKNVVQCKKTKFLFSLTRLNRSDEGVRLSGMRLKGFVRGLMIGTQLSFTYSSGASSAGSDSLSSVVSDEVSESRGLGCVSSTFKLSYQVEFSRFFLFLYNTYPT